MSCYILHRHRQDSKIQKRFSEIIINYTRFFDVFTRFHNAKEINIIFLFYFHIIFLPVNPRRVTERERKEIKILFKNSKHTTRKKTLSKISELSRHVFPFFSSAPLLLLFISEKNSSVNTQNFTSSFLWYYFWWFEGGEREDFHVENNQKSEIKMMLLHNVESSGEEICFGVKICCWFSIWLNNIEGAWESTKIFIFITFIQFFVFEVWW